MQHYTKGSMAGHNNMEEWIRIMTLTEAVVLLCLYLIIYQCQKKVYAKKYTIL
jgi:di/tricarboxylate transporter